MTIAIETRISRYEAWYQRESVDRPMIGLIWEPDIPPLPQFLESVGAGGEIQPEQIEVELFLPHVERWYQQDRELASDVIQRFTPAFGVPWVEAIAGCPVQANPGSLWAEPVLENLADRAPIRFESKNRWLRKLVDFTRTLVEFSRGRFPVAAPQLRGPLDTLAAMRTPEQMCMDMLEEPDKVSAILDELTDLWIAVGQAVLDEIPKFHGGWMGRMGSWFPGPAVTAQNDISTLVSPNQYCRFALPGDRRIASHFPYTEFHMHGSEYHQVDNLLSLDRLGSIEFTLEHTLGGPSLESMLPVVRRILEKKPLVLAALDLETADRCIAELPPKGLCVALAVNGDEIPSEIAQWLEKNCKEPLIDADER